MRDLSLRDLFLALLLVAIWGFNFVVIKVGVGEMPPLLLTALRFVFCLVPAIAFIPKPDVPWRVLIAFGLVLGVIKFGLLFLAMGAGMPAGLSSLLMQTQAFFTIGLAVLLLGERPHRWQIIGALVALVGIGLIALGKMEGASVGPFLMLIAAAFSWGAANLIAKKAGRVDMVAFIVWASLVPPLPLIALSLWIDGPDAVLRGLTQPGWIGLGAVAYLAYPVTLFGFALWNSLLSRYPAASVAPFSLLVPVFGLASATLVLGEAMPAGAWIGSALVFLGLALNVAGPRLRSLFRR